jgi:hypothetical protein
MLLMTGIALGVLFNPATGPQTRDWLRKNVLGDDGPQDYSGSNGASTPPPAVA